MQCSAVQCSVVQCSAVQCSAVQCSAVQCSAVQCSAVQCSVVGGVFYGILEVLENVGVRFGNSGVRFKNRVPKTPILCRNCLFFR